MDEKLIEWLKMPTWEFDCKGCVRLQRFVDECFDDRPIYEILFFNKRRKPKNVGPSTLIALEDIFKAHGLNLYDYWFKGQESEAERIRTQKNKDNLRNLLNI